MAQDGLFLDRQVGSTRDTFRRWRGVARRVDGGARAAAHALARSNYQRASAGLPRASSSTEIFTVCCSITSSSRANFLCADDRRRVCAQTYSPQAERPYRAFGYPLLRGSIIVAATVILLVLAVYRTQTSWPGLLARARRCADLFLLEKITPGLTCGAHFI